MEFSGPNIAVAVGLVVVGLFALVAVWHLTKSLLKFVFWAIVFGLLIVAAWWLLARGGILPTPPPAKPVARLEVPSLRVPVATNSLS